MDEEPVGVVEQVADRAGEPIDDVERRVGDDPEAPPRAGCGGVDEAVPARVVGATHVGLLSMVQFIAR